MCAARPRQGRDTNRASPQSSRDRIGAKCCRAAIARVAAVHGAPRTHPSSVVRIAGIALGWIGATTLVCFRCQERADEMWFWERSATLQGPVSRDVRNREAPPVGRLCAARHHSQAQNLTVIITGAAAVPRAHGSVCTVWRKAKMVQSISSSRSPVQLGIPLSGRPCVTVK